MAVPLLHKDKWDALPLTTTPLKPWTGRPLVGVAGSPLAVWGTIIVNIEIAREHFYTQIVVVCVLTGDGTTTPEIRQSRIYNHQGQHVLRTGDCASTGDTRETVRIPAFSEREVPARIDKPLRDGVWVLEGDRSGCLPVSVANALVNVTSYDVPVRMINTSCCF